MEGSRQRGARQRTWLDHVVDAMQEWGIDAERAANLQYSKFKRLLHKKMRSVWENRIDGERAQKPALHAYMSRYGAGPVKFEAK